MSCDRSLWFWPLLMADGIAIVADGKATLIMTDVIVILKWNNHFF